MNKLILFGFLFGLILKTDSTFNAALTEEQRRQKLTEAQKTAEITAKQNEEAALAAKQAADLLNYQTQIKAKDTAVSNLPTTPALKSTAPEKLTTESSAQEKAEFGIQITKDLPKELVNIVGQYAQFTPEEIKKASKKIIDAVKNYKLSTKEVIEEINNQLNHGAKIDADEILNVIIDRMEYFYNIAIYVIETDNTINIEDHLNKTFGVIDYILSLGIDFNQMKDTNLASDLRTYYNGVKANFASDLASD